MKNRQSVAAGFSWRRPDGVSSNGNWLRDLALALGVAAASSLLFAFADAHFQSRRLHQNGDAGGPSHHPLVIQATPVY
jgi:hypothetical protein